jgi:hypothetical protein
LLGDRRVDDECEGSLSWLVKRKVIAFPPSFGLPAFWSLDIKKAKLHPKWHPIPNIVHYF